MTSSLSLIPPLPGSYILHLRLEQGAQFPAGRLGMLILPAGDYFYCGSAHGPGGLRARLGRHLLGLTTAGASSHPHWHIDYLRPRAQALGYCCLVGQEARECAWSQALARLPGASIPASGFGSSDCRQGCASHLVRLEPVELPAAGDWKALLGEAGEITAGGMLT